MKMTNERFNTIRFIVEIVGYAGVFIAAAAEIIGFPYSSQVAGIIGALGVFTGSFVEACRRKYIADNGIGEEDDNNSN